MNLYLYTFTHADGNGDGTIEAKSEADAEKQLKKLLQGDNKLKKLEITVGELVNENEKEEVA